MVISRNNLIIKAEQDFAKTLNMIGDSIMILSQPYTVGSIYGELVEGTISGTTINGEVQPLTDKFVQSSAGKYNEGDRAGFFTPGTMPKDIVSSSGGSQYWIMYPSGTGNYYKPQEVFNWDLGLGSPIFTKVMMKLDITMTGGSL